MELTQINDLPSEMIMRIFKLLTPLDLKMAVLVCKLWREIGEHPSLWTRYFVTVANRDDLEKMKIRRLQLVDHICAYTEQTCVLKDLFQTVVTLPRLRTISGLSSNNLSSVKPGLFARVVTRLEAVNLEYTKITAEQANALFVGISEDSTLKEVSIGNNNLSSVNPSVIATAVNRLHLADVRDTQLSSEQVTEVLRQCVEGKTKLKSLILAYNDVILVDRVLIRQAREKLGDGLMGIDSEEEVGDEDEEGDEDEDWNEEGMDQYEEEEPQV